MAAPIILAIDPGSEYSGFVVWNPLSRRARAFGKVPNDVLLRSLRAGVSEDVGAVVLEWVAPRGMPASAQLFETLYVAGQLAEAAQRHAPVHRLERAEIKLHLCGQRRAKDSNVRAAIIDLFGGKEAAIGRKAAPGPLHGMHADVWAALAVALTFADNGGTL